MSIFFKVLQPREFEYRPRYYDPQQEEDPDGKRRMHFRRVLRQPRPQKKPTYRMLLLLLVLAATIWYLQTKTQYSREPIQVEDIGAEEIVR